MTEGRGRRERRFEEHPQAICCRAAGQNPELVVRAIGQEGSRIAWEFELELCAGHIPLPSTPILIRVTLNMFTPTTKLPPFVAHLKTKHMEHNDHAAGVQHLNSAYGE